MSAAEASPQTKSASTADSRLELGESVSLRFKAGRGLTAQSLDGRFALTTRVRGQIRYTGLPAGEPPERSHQFRVRRARVIFKGHFFGPDHRFKLELAVSPSDVGIDDNFAADTQARQVNRSPLLDLYFDLRLMRDLEVRIGQYKLPSNRTRVISSGDAQLVDRSIVNAEFTLDRDVGLDIRSRDLFGLGRLRYYLGASIGRGRDSVGFDDLGLTYFLRVEYLPFGFFDDYKESDLGRTRQGGLSIGAVYSYQDRNRGLRRISSRMPADGGTTTYHLGMVDAIYKHRGFSAIAEGVVRYGERNPGDAADASGAPIPVVPPRNGWGASLQGGFLLPTVDIEIAARVSVIRALGGPTETSLVSGSEVGGGLSWYVQGHPYKLQADIFRTIEGRWEDGVTRFRVQLQAGL